MEKSDEVCHEAGHGFTLCERNLHCDFVTRSNWGRLTDCGSASHSWRGCARLARCWSWRSWTWTQRPSSASGCSSVGLGLLRYWDTYWGSLACLGEAWAKDPKSMGRVCFAGYGLLGTGLSERSNDLCWPMLTVFTAEDVESYQVWVNKDSLKHRGLPGLGASGHQGECHLQRQR